MAARQPLPGRGDGPPGEARPAPAVLQGVAARVACVGGARAACPADRLGLCRPYRQHGYPRDAGRDHRGIPERRAAQDRRAVGDSRDVAAWPHREHSTHDATHLVAPR